MTLPLYQTLRDVGQGATAGAAIVGLNAAVYWLLGDAGLIGLAVLVGPGLLLLSKVLERRAKLAQKDEK